MEKCSIEMCASSIDAALRAIFQSPGENSAEARDLAPNLISAGGMPSRASCALMMFFISSRLTSGPSPQRE
jgi:hypothetical protein